MRLGGSFLERAPRIVVGSGGRRRGTGRAEIELMVANCDGVIAKGIVGRDDGRSFGQVRFQRALEHVTRIEQEHAATVGLTALAQVFDVAGQPRQGREVPVQIAGSHHRQRDVIPNVLDLGVSGQAQREQSQENPQASRARMHGGWALCSGAGSDACGSVITVARIRADSC